MCKIVVLSVQLEVPRAESALEGLLGAVGPLVALQVLMSLEPVFGFAARVVAAEHTGCNVLYVGCCLCRSLGLFTNPRIAHGLDAVEDS